jgi:hypothetical protein
MTYNRASALASTTEGATSAKIAVASVSNAGGEGKTTAAIAIEAALDLLGRPVHLVCVDEGMGSLAFQRPDAKSLSWGEPAGNAADVFERLRDRNIIFDFGANLLASGSPAVRLFWNLSELLASDGFRLAAIIPISTNKPGATGAAKLIARAFSHVESHLLLVNRDGSNNYDENTSELPTIALPHLDPVLQAYRGMLQERGMGLADAIRSPASGWTHASDYLSMWLRDFATQPKMVDLLGGDIGPVLDGLGRKARPKLRLGKLGLDGIRDETIGTMIDLSEFSSLVQQNGIWRLLYKHGLTSGGLRSAADELEQHQ